MSMPMHSPLPSQYRSKDPARRFAGLAVVVGVHVLLGYALVSGLGRKAVVAIQKPLDATVIQEVRIPPPPPPPPKIVKPPQLQAPKVEAPSPPPFVPPPEVTAPPVEAPSIVAAPTPPPEPVPIAPPPPPAPPAPEPPKPAARADIGVACPTQVKPEIPRRALQEGISGVVRAQALIQGGAVKEVTILSGPRVFHAAVRAAMLQYKCIAPDGTQAVQEFEFRIE
jgi:periplasmic protein TonB